MGQTLVEREAVLREVQIWEAGIQALHGRIAPAGSGAPLLSQGQALKGLLGLVERKNGWQLSEYAGDATPDGVQRLLAVYHWDAARCGTTCGSTWWSIWEIPEVCWWWMRRGS